MAKSYSNGPIPNNQRKCTDGFCLIIFIFLSIIIFTASLYSVLYKGLPNLTTPTDSDNKLCGTHYKNYPYLYFVSPHTDSMLRRVCVSQCPTTAQSVLNCSTNSHITSCAANPSNDSQTSVQIYPTILFLNRICLPEGRLIRQQVFQSLQIKISQNNINQFSQNWQLFALAIPATIIITMIIMLIIRFTACFSLYLVVLVVLLGLFFSMYYFYNASVSVSPQAMFLNKIPTNILYKIVVGISALIALIIFIVICCFRKRINIAINMIKASARFVNQHWYLFTVSIVKFAVTLLFLTLCIIQAWGILKFVEILFLTYDVRLDQKLHDATQIGLLVLHLFYFLWGFFFIQQSGSFIISGTVINWYFQSENLFCSSIERYAVYHSGSPCHGSFYQALFGLLKILYEWFKPNAQQKDSITGKIQKCCDFCCCICANYIFSLINRGAYAFIHLSGRSYCEASFKVLGLRASEPVMSSVMVFLQVIFSFALRLQIIALTVGAAYLVIKNVQPYSEQISDPTVILICIGVIALIVSQMFISVYIQAADTLAVCFLIDKQYGQDDQKCPYELKQYMQQTRKNDGFIE